MSMKKGAIIVSFLAVVFVVKISIYHTGSITTDNNEKTYLPMMANLFKTESKKYNKTFQILWYHQHEYFSSTESLSYCSYGNCVMTNKKSALETSDAVLFAYDPMNTDKPRKRSGQIWIIAHVESPVNNAKLNKIWDNAFDWSMTYRRDSEIFLSYSTEKRNTPLHKDYHAIFKQKTKSVVWVVSNCFTESKREKYIRELGKYIDVDIYGKCGKSKCPKNSMSECHEFLSQRYKFYLAFENSLCKDYITEKLFHTYLDKSNAIYVYRGAPNVKDILPKNTYIDVRDFDSPKALAKFMIELGSSEDTYVSYLKEIDKYRIDEGLNYFNALCSVCELLNTKQKHNNPLTGKHFNEWYRNDVCEVTNI